LGISVVARQRRAMRHRCSIHVSLRWLLGDPTALAPAPLGAQQANDAEISVPLVLGNQAPIEQPNVASRTGDATTKIFTFSATAFAGRNWSAAIGGVQRIIWRTSAGCAEPAAAERA
jgi:hypothetical protein